MARYLLVLIYIYMHTHKHTHTHVYILHAVVIGRTYVRVRHEGVTKGCFVEYVTNHYNKRGGVDMLMVIGLV